MGCLPPVSGSRLWQNRLGCLLHVESNASCLAGVIKAFIACGRPAATLLPWSQARRWAGGPGASGSIFTSFPTLPVTGRSASHNSSIREHYVSYAVQRLSTDVQTRGRLNDVEKLRPAPGLLGPLQSTGSRCAPAAEPLLCGCLLQPCTDCSSGSHAMPCPLSHLQLRAALTGRLPFPSIMLTGRTILCQLCASHDMGC